MTIRFISDDESKNPGIIIDIADMDHIPRVNETITFMPSEDGQEYKVTHVDYEISSSKTCNSVDVWLMTY
jgi:hypothetical protein